MNAWGPKICLIAGALGLGAGAPVAAQVYQIDDTGGVQVRQGGGSVTWRDAATPPPLGKNFGASPVSAPFAPGPLLQQAAAQAGLSPVLLEALVWQESRWHPNAISPKGAVGLTQLMPGTAKDLGVDAKDPVANLFGGARHLRRLLDHFNGDLIKALAAYNAGIKRVEAAGGIPPIRETQDYVRGILGRLDRAINKH